MVLVVQIAHPVVGRPAGEKLVLRVSGDRGDTRRTSYDSDLPNVVIGHLAVELDQAQVHEVCQAVELDRSDVESGCFPSIDARAAQHREHPPGLVGERAATGTS